MVQTLWQQYMVLLIVWCEVGRLGLWRGAMHRNVVHCWRSCWGLLLVQAGGWCMGHGCVHVCSHVCMRACMHVGGSGVNPWLAVCMCHECMPWMLPCSMDRQQRALVGFAHLWGPMQVI